MKKAVVDYVEITKLSKNKQPDLFENEGKGYFYTHNNANACVFHNGDGMQFIGYVEFAPFRSRGNHFHLKKDEYICFVSGTAKAQFVLPEAPEKIYEINIDEGDIVHILPGCAHSFITEEKSAAVEFSMQKYQQDDTKKYCFVWENELF